MYVPTWVCCHGVGGAVLQPKRNRAGGEGCCLGARRFQQVAPCAKLWAAAHDPSRRGRGAFSGTLHRAHHPPLQTFPHAPSPIVCHGLAVHWRVKQRDSNSIGGNQGYEPHAPVGVQAEFDIPADAYKVDLVFSDVESGEGNYDNQGGFDYHLPVIGSHMAEPPLHVMHISVEMAPICKVQRFGVRPTDRIYVDPWFEVYALAQGDANSDGGMNDEAKVRLLSLQRFLQHTIYFRTAYSRTGANIR